MVSKERKLALTKEFGKSDKDTGSVEVQIAILTEDIENLKPHFLTNKKDLHSKRGFIAKINRRKKYLSYLKENDFASYQNVIKKLNLRK
ncbi:MAG: 30S ribosomal protein S15 [Metamycoplasmataceae bacterium]